MKFSKHFSKLTNTAIMKKHLFCILLIFGTVTYLSAQESVLVVQPAETVVIKPAEAVVVKPAEMVVLKPAETVVYKADQTCVPILVTNMSIGFKTGVNYFNTPPAVISRKDKLNLTFGAMLDYTINPVIGLGLEYYYIDYSRPYNYLGVKGNLVGGTHDVILYSSVNLSNAFSPYRAGIWRNLNIYGDVGGGYAFYHFHTVYGAQNTTNNAMVGKVALNAEFTLNDAVNLCIEGQYRQYDNLNMSGSRANRNIDAVLLSVGLRFKFLSGTTKHARNISLCEYTPKPAPVIIKKTFVQGDTDATLYRLKTIEQENADLKIKMQKVQDDAKNAAIQKELIDKNKALNQQLQKNEEDSKDQKSLVSQNSALNQKLLKMEEDLKLLATKKEGVVNASFESIEFQFGSRELTPASAKIMDQIANILINNSYWTGLKISGHTDAIGTTQFNQKLSEERAFAVKKYLLAKGVPSTNVVAIGWGENKPIDTNDTPEGRQNNRRVEFEMRK
jgi:outer membrane protein OmpA-like peptidoglycan-associated protein